MISVIIPCFNTDDLLLEECIESVISQTYNNLEIIVVDDGSEKEQLLKIKRVTKKHKEVRLICVEHKGLATARNVGIDQSHGEFITFIDSDDIIAPNMIEDLYSVATREAASVVVGYIDLFNNGESYRFYKSDIVSAELSHDDQEKLALVGFATKKSELGFLSCGPCAALYKSELVKSILFPTDLEIFEDVYWNVLVFRASEKTIKINQTVYAYRQVKESITHTWKLSTINKRIKALAKIEKIVSNQNEQCSLRWYAVRVLNNYTTILSVIMKTNELMGRKERISYANEQTNNLIWRVLDTPGISCGWSLKNKLKLALYRRKLLVVVYYLKYGLR